MNQRLIDQIIAHVDHQRINIDSEDGVKVNYQKFQGVEVPQWATRNKKYNKSVNEIIREYKYEKKLIESILKVLLLIIYLNRMFDIELEQAIEGVKSSQILKECNEDDISIQEWPGKFLKELDLDIDSNKETVKNKRIYKIA